MNLRTRASVAVALSLLIPTLSFGEDSPYDFEAVTLDALVARPCWFVATVVGAGLFVVSLPVSALSKSVNKTAKTLVGKPAAATFKRPLGDFSSVE
jgi:hypothetical protein